MKITAVWYILSDYSSIKVIVHYTYRLISVLWIKQMSQTLFIQPDVIDLKNLKYEKVRPSSYKKMGI